MRAGWLHLVLILWFAATPLGAQDLRVTLPAGDIVEYPLYNIDDTLCLAINHASEIFRGIDPNAKPRWDASSRIYLVTLFGRSFTLFADRAELMIDGEPVRTDQPLTVRGGLIFVPLDSLQRILNTAIDIDTNLDELLGRAEVGIATPIATPMAPAVPEPEAPPQTPPPFFDSTPTATPSPEMATPSPIPRQIEDLLKQPTGLPPTPSPYTMPERPALPPATSEADRIGFEASLADAARRLEGRWTVVIDPQPPRQSVASASVVESAAENSPDAPMEEREESAGDVSEEDFAADLCLRIARRCRTLLNEGSSLNVVLTREDAGSAPSLERRLTTITRSRAKALVCLRIDASRHSLNRGYRLFITQDSVDPQGRPYRGRSALYDALPLEAAYVPYQDLSRQLAGNVIAELSRGAIPAAPEALRLAPLHLLKRANMPGVSVSLGYVSNLEDLQIMHAEEFVENTARQITQAILEFDRSLSNIARRRN